MATPQTLPDLVTSTKTSFKDSDVRNLIEYVNQLSALVAGSLMPGCLLSDPATKTGTSSAKTWRTEAFTFTFRGKQTSAAAQEKAFTATTHDVAASKEAWFVLSVQTDGTTFTITKGADQTIGTKVLPTTPDNEIPVAWLKMTTGAGGIWDASTDDLTVSGNVASLTFYDAPNVKLIADVAGVEITSSTP